MYVCLDTGARLPHNEHLECTFFSNLNIKVYGDAFIVKSKPDPKDSDHSVNAHYVDMDGTFVSNGKVSAFAKLLLIVIILRPIEEVAKRSKDDYQCER